MVMFVAVQMDLIPVLTRGSVASALGNTATDSSGINPDTYSGCLQTDYFDFEALPDGTNLSASTVSGVQFTTTGGYTWLVGDFATGLYHGKYPNGGYTSQGTHWAWLGPNQGSGRIDFANGPVDYFSLLVSAATPVQLDAYDQNNNLLATAGPLASNYNTGTMDELKVTRAARDVAYVIIHDTGNYFEVDAICTDASGTAITPTGGPIGVFEQPSGDETETPVQCQATPNPINCATGNFWHSFDDLAVPGRGVTLDVRRTYNSIEAAQDSPFGFGWSSSYAANMTASPSPVRAS